MQFVEVEPGEGGVTFEFARIIVDAVVDNVGVALGLEGLDQGDLLGDVFGRFDEVVGLEHVQRVHAFQEVMSKEFGDFPSRFAVALGALFELIFALVGIRH